eukprot:1430345-Alexandrium_andersonii.AAC.1
MRGEGLEPRVAVGPVRVDALPLGLRLARAVSWPIVRSEVEEAAGARQHRLLRQLGRPLLLRHGVAVAVGAVRREVLEGLLEDL